VDKYAISYPDSDHRGSYVAVTDFLRGDIDENPCVEGSTEEYREVQKEKKKRVTMMAIIKRMTGGDAKNWYSMVWVCHFPRNVSGARGSVSASSATRSRDRRCRGGLFRALQSGPDRCQIGSMGRILERKCMGRKKS
jgi:hypothetical protein